MDSDDSQKSINSIDSDVSQEQMNLKDNSFQEINPINQIYEIQDHDVYIKTNPEGIQKLFYYHPVEEPLNFPLAEGDIKEYQIHSIAGQNYYPLILGYEEAKIMRKESLFKNIGDPIKNFFGKNVVIIGVLKKTNGALDMAHIIPLNAGELN